LWRYRAEWHACATKYTQNSAPPSRSGVTGCSGNDGKLLAEDQIIPGRALLGCANADHWSVALQVEDRFPFLAHRSAGKYLFPQQALLGSSLELVQEDLGVASMASQP
jgi:hypothetical protein